MTDLKESVKMTSSAQREAEQRLGRAAALGAAAGTLSALIFTILHQWMISPIWFMAVPMLVAGALCGVCLAVSYALLAREPSRRGWLTYNGLYLLLLALLGPVSLLVFEPMITLPALIASPNGLPADLARKALPLTAAYTLFMAASITLVFGRGWSRFGAVLAACAVLMLLLGLNISATGLVFLSGDWLPIMGEMFVLVVGLTAVYALAFAALDRGKLLR